MTITVKKIADSVSPVGIRLPTLQLKYPKFIHGEFLTHRTLSRNSSSSRAIPVERLVQDIIDDPVIPSFWGKNQKGMQADEECNELVLGASREEAWLSARDYAIDVARFFSKVGYHKQIVNRLIEPFCHINTVVTATDWDNFFALRCHKDAQPEMRLLAETIRNIMEESKPIELKLGQWHLPYVTEIELAQADTFGMETLVKVSVARCARVSYLTHEGKPSCIVDDLKLYNILINSVPAHASPAEHQATPDRRRHGKWVNPEQHGNFRGWCQCRKIIGL